MSEYRDPYRRTPVHGVFFENLHGDAALAAAEQAEAKRLVEAERVSEAERLAKVSQPEPPVAIVDESSVPVEASSTVQVESEASTAHAPIVEPVVPSADSPVVS